MKSIDAMQGEREMGYLDAHDAVVVNMEVKRREARGEVQCRAAGCRKEMTEMSSASSDGGRGCRSPVTEWMPCPP